MEHKWTNGIPGNGSYGDNGPSPYYDPPKGFSVFADVDTREEPYEFSQVVVWREDATGRLFAAADSGCSCPTPFSDLTVDGMAEIRKVADLDPLFDSLWGAGDSQRVGIFKAKVGSALASFGR